MTHSLIGRNKGWPVKRSKPMKSIDILMSEHKRILSVLEILSAMIAAIWTIMFLMVAGSHIWLVTAGSSPVRTIARKLTPKIGNTSSEPDKVPQRLL